MRGRLFFHGHHIKAITFDVTGTLLQHRYPIAQTYAECAKWAQLAEPPTQEEIQPAFKKAYKETLLKFPYFRHPSNEWWKVMLQRTIDLTGRTYTQPEFDRYYLRVFQHFGSAEGYRVLEDTLPFLRYVQDKVQVLGVISNCPARTITDSLPMLGLHNHFHFFLSAEAVRGQKPDLPIFQAAQEQANFWARATATATATAGAAVTGGGTDSNHAIHPSEILHIGDAFVADYVGARSAGMQSALLNRSTSVVLNDWLTSPELPGEHTAAMVAKNTFADFYGVQGVMSHLP